MARAEDEPYHRSFLSALYRPILRPDDFVDADREAAMNPAYPVQGNVYRPGSPPGLPDFVRWKNQPSISPNAARGIHPKLAKALGLDSVKSPEVRELRVSREELRKALTSGVPLPVSREDVVNTPTSGPPQPNEVVLRSQVALPKPGVRHRAYMADTDHLVSMQEKDDQQFLAFSHEWERAWSPLVLGPHRPFTPIVDSSWRVWGYMGTVMGGSGVRKGSGIDADRPVLCVPENRAGIGDLKRARTNGVVVFVHSANTVPDGWVVAGMYTPEHEVEVRTSIDGEVLDFQVTSTGHLEQPWYSPSDIYNAAKILANLGKFGLIWTRSLMCKMTAKLEGRAILKGATALLARESEKKAAKSASREILESDLIRLARNKTTPSRLLTNQQMEAHLRDVLRKRPYLERLRTVTSNDGLMKILQDWEKQTGNRFLITKKVGLVNDLKSEGVGGWAIDQVSRKTVLVLEEQVFKNTRDAILQVTHELAYEAVWEGPKLAVPHLIKGGRTSASEWLEHIIRTGDPGWEFMRTMGVE
jgi:hypothetical protein